MINRPRYERSGLERPPNPHQLIEEFVKDLVSAKLDAEVDFSYSDTPHARLRLASKSGWKRSVLIGPSEVFRYRDIDLAAVVPLERYDAISFPSRGTIESAIRAVRPIGYSRFARSLSDRGELLLERDGLRLTIGPLSDEARALLDVPFGRSQDRPSSRSLGFRVEGASFDTATADEVLERLADAVFLDLALRDSVVFVLRRVRRRHPVDRLDRRPAEAITTQFPQSQYPHEPAALLRESWSVNSTPLVQYWTLYQILEYFFPQYVMQGARETARQMLLDPRFDPHSSEDVSRLVERLALTQRSRMDELAQLKATISAIVDEATLREFVSDRPTLNKLVADKNSEVSSERVLLQTDEDLPNQVSRRIYDVRCRIVHARSDGGASGRPGLIVGAHHEDFVLAEIPLIRFLAERALVASAEPLDVRTATKRKSESTM